jgi:hypothetical protein
VEAGGEGRGLEHEIALDDELAHELIGEQDRRTLPQLVGIYFIKMRKEKMR